MSTIIPRTLTAVERIHLRGGRVAKLGKHAVSYAPVLGLVGAAAVFGAGDAQAANECGVADINGVATCTTDPSSYGGVAPGTQVGYTVGAGAAPFTLVINDPLLDISTSGTAVTVNANTATSPDVAVDVQQLSQITTSADSARGIYVNQVSETGSIDFNMANGTIVTGGSTGTTNTAHGVFLDINRAASLGNVTLDIDGGAITTTGGVSAGVLARINNATSLGAVSAGVSDLNLVSVSHGLQIQNNGFGGVDYQMSGGTVETTGSNAHGVYVWQNKAGATGNIDVVTTGGTITTNGSQSSGVRIQSSGGATSSSTVTADISGMSINSFGRGIDVLSNSTGDVDFSLRNTEIITNTTDTQNGRITGANVLISQADTTATLTVHVEDVDISVNADRTGAANSYGVNAQHGGQTGVVNMTVAGTNNIDVTGNGAFALLAESSRSHQQFGSDVDVNMFVTGTQVLTADANGTAFAGGILGTSRTAGDVYIEVDGDVSIDVNAVHGRGIYAYGASEQVGPGDLTVVVRNELNMEMAGDYGRGVAVNTEGNSANLTVLFDNSTANINMLGDATQVVLVSADGYWVNNVPSTQDANALIRITGGNNEFSTTGDGATTIKAQSWNSSANNNLTIEIDGSQLISANGENSRAVSTNTWLTGAAIPTGDQTISIAAGSTLNATGSGAAAVGATLTGEAGHVDINLGAITVDVQGDGATGVVVGVSDATHSDSVTVDLSGTSLTVNGADPVTGLSATGGAGVSTTHAGAGDTTITFDASASIDVGGDNSFGVLGTSSGSGDVIINAGGTVDMNGSNAIGVGGSHSGIGDVTINADTGGSITVAGANSVAVGGEITNSTSDGALTINLAGDVAASGNGSIGVLGSVDGTGATTININDTANLMIGAVAGTDSDVIGVAGTGTGSGDIVINAGGAVTANGTDAVGVGGSHSGTGDVTINADTAGVIRATGANAIAVGAEITNASSDGVLTINVNGNVSASGDGSSGVAAANDGTGDVSIASIGNIAAVGNGAIGIAIDTTSGSGGFQLDLDAGSVSGDQTAVYIDTGAGSTGAVNIASGVTVGSSSNTSALNIVGSGTGVVTNAGTVLGGIDVLGDFVNDSSGTVTVGGGQGFSVSNDLVNNGMIDAADGAVGGVVAIGGNLSGNGKVLIDVDATAGTSDRIILGGSIASGSNVTVDANVIAGIISNDTSAVLAQIFTVGGAVAEDSTYVVNAGFLSFEFEAVDGALSAPTIVVADEVQVYTATPTALASNFTRIGSTQTRLSNRVYARQANAGGSAPISVSSKGTFALPSQIGGAWAAISAERMKSSRSTGAIHKDTYQEIEGGYDAVVATANGGTLVIGVSAHVGQLSSNVTSRLGSGSNLSATGLGVGASATYFAPTGTYFDANLRITSAKSDISSAGVELASGVKSLSYTGSIEMGHRFVFDGIGIFTPSAQLTIGQTDIDGFTDSTGIAVNSSEQSTREARLGVTYERALAAAGEGSTFRVSADYFRDLSPASEITASGTTLTSKGERDWLEVGLGATLNTGANSRITFDAAYSFAPENRSDNNGLRATIGYQMQW